MVDPTTAQISQLISRSWQQTADIRLLMRIRRLLISRESSGTDDNSTGTALPPPFNTTSLAVRTMIDAPASAAQHYASRISSNQPDIEVIPITSRSNISQTVDRMAGEQERLDSELWDSAGGRAEMWRIGWAMSLGGVGYYLTLPRDADWGLPDRRYYDDMTDDEVKKIPGKTPNPVKSPSGKMVYAEHGDVWAGRRKETMGKRATSGRSLFTLRAFPRDMVQCEKDSDGIKWACIVEEVPGDSIGVGSPLARSAAKLQNIDAENLDTFGIFLNSKGEIIGGVSHGGPSNSDWKRPDIVNVIRYFDRKEQIIMVAPRGSVESAYVVYRGEHGCTIQGQDAVPVVEVPFFRTDVDVPRFAFSTPLDKIFAYTPLINQIETLRSNATVFNLIPRWVFELKDGSILRGEDGEPKIIESGAVPGLNPNEAAAYPGTLKQLTIETADTDSLLKIYLEQLANAMPAPVTTGASGTSGAAWTAQTLIQQAQETLRQAVDNHAYGVRQILQMMHGWLRELDVPVYFHAAPTHRRNRRDVRGLIEFEPVNLTDSLRVTQELDTPQERTVSVQIGMTLWQQGAIDDQTFYSEYMKTQDSRQAIIDRYVQMTTDYVVYGKVPANSNPDIFPKSVISQVAEGVRGAVHYELLNSSPNYALANARQQAQEAQQQAQQAMVAQQTGGGGMPPPAGPMAPPPGQAPGAPPELQPQEPQTYPVANAAGIRRPGMGMSSTLDQQLGQAVPGGQAMATPVGTP